MVIMTMKEKAITAIEAIKEMKIEKDCVGIPYNNLVYKTMISELEHWVEVLEDMEELA